MFEITKRDGLARLGRFHTRAGILETPALLPVVNPKISTVSPRELHDEFGFKALITNSYIIKNNENLRNRALSEGLHKMLDFPGIIMTDSGTFQSHMYGEVEVTNEEMVNFQRDIGTDIGTVLDIFTEPFWTHEKTANSIVETLKRTEAACGMKGDMMINGVGQGSIFMDLRESCARTMATMDIDVHPIGGVVPVMEQYRYAELVDIVISSKKGLNPSRPVHLFGAGHPMLFALAVLMGCDLFDSASYAKFARDDRLMFVDGTYRLQDMQSLDCNCPACRGLTIESLRKLKPEARTKTIAKHNLYEITSELALVKRYVQEGRLWELAETRCRSHPALLDALRRLRSHVEFMERHEPVSRDGAIFHTGRETLSRPVFERYAKRMSDRYVPLSDTAVIFQDGNSKPYNRVFAEEFAKARSQGLSPIVMSPFGPVPTELDEVYPLAQSVFPDTIGEDLGGMRNEFTKEFLERHFNKVMTPNEVSGGSMEFNSDLERAKAVARYQFGPEVADLLIKGDVELVTSRKTGKIRNVISDGEHVLSMRAGDGLYTLRLEGGARIVNGLKGRMRVVLMDDAVPFVSTGKNVFPQFVISCDESLIPMDEVVIVNQMDDLVATGRMILTGEEMKYFKKGVAVKTRSGVQSGTQPEEGE